MHPAPQPTGPRPWHSLDAAEVARALGSGPDGLAPDEARRRLEEHGPNRLPAAKRRGPFLRLLVQFHNLLIYVLLVAATVAALLGHWLDAAVILGVVVVNALVGFLQEGKAEKALESIRELLSPKASVVRGGRRAEIDAPELVSGDWVLLEAGDRVPADLRLVQAKELRVDEAILTGEAEPAFKGAGPAETDAPVGDRSGMAYSGTIVTYGQGAGVVVATGPATEIGRISELLSRVETLTTPLLRQMDRFARWLTAAIIVLAGVTFAIGFLLRDYTAVEMFMAAVSLMVAAIPEGLPAILTVTLAIGVRRMARRNALIRRLPAVETLGSVTVICSDKTGTLTRNEMTVQALAAGGFLYEVEGSGYEPRGVVRRAGRAVTAAEEAGLAELGRAGVLCNDAGLEQTDGQWRVQGDPTEGALLTLGHKLGLDPSAESRALPRADHLPFQSELQYMATLHGGPGGARIYLKGAPERVLDMCSREWAPGGDAPLDRPAWEAWVEELAGRGQRVLALAAKPAPAGRTQIRRDDVGQGLVLLGLVGILDPPRDEAITAVAQCHAAGIRVKMITGDHARTALAIGRRVGIGDGSRAVTGVELEKASAGDLREWVRTVDVFARSSPEHKLRLVEALQAEGEVVAMTGDGVNDAPALKRADIGVAMGIKGTEVSKEAAAMVLADDNFASIAHAVEEGRTVYDNLHKAIVFILPTNAAEALVVLAAIALGRTLPITPAQILWVNMVTAVTLALALAFEPPEADVMNRPPRNPREPLLTPFVLWRTAYVAAILVAGTFGLFLWERAAGSGIELSRTVAVNVLVLFEVFYLFSTRYLRRSVLSREGLLGNRAVLVAAATVVGLQVLFTHAPPMQALFHTVPLDLGAWLRVTLTASSVFVLVEAGKYVAGRLRGGEGTA